MSRLICFVSALVAAACARAHGPVIQVTVTDGTITTREILLDGPYGNSLTPPKTVYVMPFLDSGGVTYARPNNVDFVLPGVPEFFSGPGLAYGYGYDATTNPEPFAVGSDFSLAFTAGLKKWDGSAFVDPGDAEIQAFTGSLANISGTATTTDNPAQFQSLQLPGGPATVSFTAEEKEAHSMARYRYLGDGVNPSTAPDGIYLLSFRLFNDSSGAPSDPFYFVLNRNSPPGALPAAVASLGANSDLVQWLVPEPASSVCAAIASFAVAAHARRRKAGRI